MFRLTETKGKMPALNERFGASGAVTRLKVCANLQVLRPSERHWKPRLPQAAATLEAMRAQPSSSANLKKIRSKVLRNLTNRSNRTVLFSDRYFFNLIESWLLPCSLRSHRIANPRPKMGFAIFRLCPPTTRQVVELIVRANSKNEKSRIIFLTM